MTKPYQHWNVLPQAFGRPAFLIVPNDHHRLDVKAWKDRYPQLQVVAPKGSRAKVEEVVQVDTTAPDFGDPDVQFVTVAGTREREAALVVRTRNGTTLSPRCGRLSILCPPLASLTRTE